MLLNHSFETRPGGSTRGRNGNQAGLTKKQGKGKPGVTRRVDLVTRLTRSRPGDKPIDFCFFFVFFFLLKRRRFDFFLRIDPADPVKPGDPAKTWNPSLGPGRPPDRVLKLCTERIPSSVPLCQNITYRSNKLTA